MHAGHKTLPLATTTSMFDVLKIARVVKDATTATPPTLSTQLVPSSSECGQRPKQKNHHAGSVNLQFRNMREHSYKEMCAPGRTLTPRGKEEARARSDRE
jgi:hypothetical protein